MTASGDSLEIRRKRLLFRSWHRGTREMDLLLGSFAERNLRGFSADQIDLYERLLEYSDSDLYDWMTGRVRPPAEADNPVLKLIREFKYVG